MNDHYDVSDNGNNKCNYNNKMMTITIITIKSSKTAHGIVQQRPAQLRSEIQAVQPRSQDPPLRVNINYCSA